MKLTFKDDKDKTPFSKMFTGSTFQFNDSIYMRIQDTPIPRQELKYNAVCLGLLSGKLLAFEDDVLVTPVKTELVVSYETN